MLCPHCGTENPFNAKFCYECGINLSNAINTEVEIDNSNVQLEDIAEDNFREESETKETDSDSNSSNNNCIVCKYGEMVPTVHNGSFGFGIKKTLECNNCGAVFEKKGQKYKLSKITDINQPIWIKYGHQILTILNIKFSLLSYF